MSLSRPRLPLSEGHRYHPERKQARDAYEWSSVEKDLALSTHLTVSQASQFGRPYMEHTGIHPFDLVELVYDFYKQGVGHDVSPDRVRMLIMNAFMAGKRAV